MYKSYYLKEIPDNSNKNLKAFGTFLCAGGSSIGYKLAGFNHLGGVELDPKCAKLYELNLSPKYLYVEDIRLFNKRNDLPDELYNLDILDGSPPCSTFSTAGSRENAWGKEKKFREGQQMQVLDDLVYIYIETINKLRPKVALLENVEGIIKGNAKLYAKNIVLRLNSIGYDCQVFNLNSATMGLPQARQRVFFIARQKALNLNPLALNFNLKGVPFGLVRSKEGNSNLTEHVKTLLKHYQYGDKSFSKINQRINSNANGFTQSIVSDASICPTITSAGDIFRAHDLTKFSNEDLINCGTFPIDYDFQNQSVKYYVGMSVPPRMIFAIVTQIKLQWFNQTN